MSPDSPAKLIRLDLSNGAPSTVTTIAEGSARDMVTLAITSASGDLWRYAVRAAGGVPLLPDEIARLHGEWGVLLSEPQDTANIRAS